MAWISTTYLAASTGGVGKFFVSRPTAGTLTQHRELALPSGFKVTKTRPSVAGYNGRAYYVNVGSDNAMVDEYYRVLRQGLIAPNTVPTLAASGTGVTGSAVVAIAWYDSLLDEWSPLSASSSAVALVNQGRTTGNIPATPPEGRYDKVGVFVSMDGAAYRLATTRQVGVTLIAENVATLSLISVTGITDGSGFERAPRATCNTFYHDRQVWAGDSRHPDTVYVSVVGLPERYGGLSFRTRGGEPIVGLGSNRDVCLVFTPFNYYVLRGFTDDDMTMTLGDSVGCCSHATIQVINDRIYWANDHGAWMYNGAPHYLMKDMAAYWQRLFASLPDDFEDAFGIADPNEFTYSIVLGTLPVGAADGFDLPDPGPDFPATIAFVCDYGSISPELGGGISQPDWVMDAWDRTTECAALLALPNGRRRDPYYGNCDGTIRRFSDDPTNGDYQTDDQDAYDKLMWIRTKAYDFDDPGGDAMEGKTLVRYWTYAEIEDDTWTVYAQGGDEKAYQQLLPDNTALLGGHKDDMPVSASSGQQTFPGTGGGSFETVIYAAKSVHPHIAEKCSGRSFTFQYKINNPGSVNWRGVGGTYKPGDATRYPIFVNEGE